MERDQVFLFPCVYRLRLVYRINEAIYTSSCLQQLCTDSSVFEQECMEKMFQGFQIVLLSILLQCALGLVLTHLHLCLARGYLSVLITSGMTYC